MQIDVLVNKLKCLSGEIEKKRKRDRTERERERE